MEVKNSELFNGTYEYYAKYRPDIPKEVIDILIGYFKINQNDRILDIGCGTGQVAIAMEGRCGEMVCMDADSKMLKQAKKATKDSEINFTWLVENSENLQKIKDNVGTFKIATICRAFHWMNQEQVLNDLDYLIDKDGGIAIFGDGSFWTGQEKWQQTVKSVVQKYLGEKRRAGKKKFKQPVEPWEKIIARSSFKFIKTQQVQIKRDWNIESIIGWLFSSSFASPNHFGDKLNAFKKEIETALLKLNPDGTFQENAVFSIILASRENR